jgi:hypothetical protein
MIHDSHYGLIRQTSERSITNLVSVNEIWFVQSDEVQTPIECWHDERHPEREQDKHLFEVKQLNALVEVKYNRAQMRHWLDTTWLLTPSAGNGHPNGYGPL